MKLKMLMFCVPSLALVVSLDASAVTAQPPAAIPPVGVAPVIVERPPADAYPYPTPSKPDPVRSWIFRRYAGSVEMQDKVFYPRDYYGQYYFRGWQPDWVYPGPPSPNRNCDYCEEGYAPYEMSPELESRRTESGAWGAAKKKDTRVSRLPAPTTRVPPRTKP